MAEITGAMEEAVEEKLARLLMEHSYMTRRPDAEPFVLASGKTSLHYFDCERTTTFALALPLLGQVFYQRLRPGVVAVGGPTRGADPIADAIAYYSVLHGSPVNVFSVRKSRKDHGITGWVDGCAQAGDRVAFVDDVVTSGGSLLDALVKCREEGLQIAQVLLLVDRQEQNGLQRLQEAVGPDVPVEAIFTYAQLLATLPKE